MKKLLTILGSISIIGLGSSSVMAMVPATVKTQTDKNVQAINQWQTNAEAPKNNLEWIGGVWRLEFNHELTQDLVSGSAKASDVADLIGAAIKKIPKLGEKISDISKIVAPILDLASKGFDKADKGNGVLIRFGGWVLPTKVTNSTHTWN